jgi:hypothetical protein
MFLDTIHRPAFNLNTVPYISKQNVSDIGFCHIGPEIGTSSIDWAQLSKIYLGDSVTPKFCITEKCS